MVSFPLGAKASTPQPAAPQRWNLRTDIMKYRASTAVTSSPVAIGEFDDGSDAMLWHPHLSRARWRRETLRAALPARVVLCGLLGVAFVAEGIAGHTGLAAVLTAGLGVLAVGSATVAAVVNAACFDTDHAHDRHRPCRLEQRPGEFFYRTKDFLTLGTGVHDTVAGVLDAVHQLHSTPARAWLHPDLPREAHLVAWEVLCCLDRTRTARAVADQLRGDHEAGELAARANDAITVIDQALAEVLRHLRHCVALAQAWTTKLRHADLETRVQDTLVSLGDAGAARIAADAEVLPQNVFAFVTAARDVTGTGPFPWEQPAAPLSRTPNPQGHARAHEPAARDGGLS